MMDLKYLDRALRDEVVVSKGKLRIRRVNLGNLTNMEKNEYRIFLARSKRLTYPEQVKFKAAFPALLIMVNPPLTKRGPSNE